MLVNCAGAAKRTPPDSLTPPVWREAFDAKFFSYINVTDPMVKRMSTRGSGVIVSVIGAGSKAASETHLAGGSANAALMLATAGLRAAYAKRGVRVIGVSRGLTETGRVAEGLAAEARLANVGVDKRGGEALSGSRSAAWPRRVRSPAWSCSLPQRKRATSLASSYRWTAARTRSCAERAARA
jgi:NAD(P)-dependent dehydrogenase (short-subunit alcohol dehydrogenase family)